MPRLYNPHAGSLQFWPRKRAEKKIPSVNWKNFSSKKGNGILGFLSYKVGMGTAIVKDSTEHSMTKGKKITVPVTILEVPNMKIFSVRFYKNGVSVKDVIVSNDKELKRILKVPKEVKPFDSQVPTEYDDLRVIAYSIPKQISLRKTPNINEFAINADNKLEFVKSLIGKEITSESFLQSGLVDVRALTKGKGLVGPVQRFGITLKQHKTEKGVRRPGSLGPWHPARVTYVTPQAGQLGVFTRVHYNQNIILLGKSSDKDINPKSGFHNYGKVSGSYIVLSGSVQGPSKNPVLLTTSFRPTKKTIKRKYEFLELII